MIVEKLRKKEKNEEVNLIKGGSDQVAAVGRMVLDGGDEVQVSWDGVDCLAFPQIPYLHRVVVAPRRDVEAVGREVERQDLLDVALHYVDASSRPQIPHPFVCFKRRTHCR